MSSRACADTGSLTVSFGFLALPRHWARLKRSAKLLHIPFDMTCQEWIDANHSLI